MFLSWQEHVGKERAAKIQQQLAQQAIAANCKHCWHDTGYVLTSNPPINTYYCCNCDQRKQESFQYRAPTGHGQFLKKQPY